MDPAFQSATNLIRALRRKKIGALELLELYIQRVEQYDTVLRLVNAPVGA